MGNEEGEGDGAWEEEANREPRADLAVWKIPILYYLSL